MKRALLHAIAVAALLPVALLAATSPPPSPLDAMIHLVEQRETGQLVPLGFDTTMWKADINSTIKIQVTPLSTAAGVAPAQTPLSQSANAFRVSGHELLQAVPLRAEIDRLKELVKNSQGAAQTEQTKQLAKLGSQFGELFAPATGAILAYRQQAQTTNDSALQAHAEAFYANANAMLTGGKDKTFAETASGLSKLLTDEGEFLLGKLQADMARLAATGSSQALLMAASSSKDNYLALAHYSTIAPGAPVPFDKLNPLPSPAAAAALRADFDAANGVAQLLNDIKSGKTTAREAIESILKSNNVDFATTKKQVAAVVADLANLKLSDADDALKKIAATISATLASNPANAAVLQKLQSDVGTLEVDLAAFGQTSQALATAIRQLDPRLTSASLQQTTDPVAALSILVADFNAVRNLPNAGAADVGALSTQVTTAFDTARAILADLDNVKKSLSTVSEATLVNDVTKALASVPSLQQLITDAKDLQTSLNAILKAVRDIGAKDLNVGAYNPNPPDTSLAILLSQPKDTELNFQEATPQLKENDVVTLQAWIYEVTPGPDGQLVLGKQLSTAVQQFKIVRYGWFADAGAGVTYVFSTVKPPGSDKETQQFAPQVAFLFHDRPWPGKPQPSNLRDPWFTSWGAGIHAISLDLDRNSQLELGLGVTLSATRGFIQVGFGRDLTLKRNYWLLGTTLFKFLSNLGIKVP